MNTDSCAGAEAFALRVLGDSMLPEFKHGHIVIVDPGMPAVDGAFVVIDYDDDTTLGQFVTDGDRSYLKPLNDSYPTIELTGSYHIHGVVVQRAGQHRKDHKHYY